MAPTTSGRNTLVASSVVEISSLHAHTPRLWHIYGVPFVVPYIGWAYLRFNYYEELLGSPEFATFSFMLVVAAHALSFLVCQWSVHAKAFLTCRTVSDPYQASVIKIIPTTHNGAGTLCPIVAVPSEKSGEKKRKFIYDGDKHQFLFCVFLWFLDDMWYYSLFTLFMLIVFESTVVFQRLRSLQEFRAMSIKPYAIQVFRSGKWTEIMTDALLPGDLCSVLRSKDEAPVPADLLLVGGSCIANEAMLSGESTPQLKESATTREKEDIFDIDTDKNCVLFGGTKVIQVTPPPAEGKVSAPPDGGSVAVVLRTGFATQQGGLVRTIIYSTERVTANNVESLFFILFLLIFAIAAAWYVWVEGMKNEERKQSKVLLDCILIVTSVVPPELPMELSLAVNNSILSLTQAYIFCTEPFRIPFAGKVDVACFDKTGTLTAEDLVVEGIAGLLRDHQHDGPHDRPLVKADHAPKETRWVLAAAQALVVLDGEEAEIAGDPMEKNTLEAAGWAMSRGDIVAPSHHASGSGHPPKRDKAMKIAPAPTSGPFIRILRRFPFSSALKRMSTVSALNEGSGGSRCLVTAKGAPETLRSMIDHPPADYDAVYKHWARRGARVLALGYKFMDNSAINKVKDLHRDQVESGL
ncbi:hypothetical protein HK405_005034, partial [Cladochytrium tenue]